MPHTLSPDVQDNVTVKFQTKMVTGGKKFHGLYLAMFCKVFNCGVQLLLPDFFSRGVSACVWGQFFFILSSLLRFGFKFNISFRLRLALS